MYTLQVGIHINLLQSCITILHVCIMVYNVCSEKKPTLCLREVELTTIIISEKSIEAENLE